MAAHEQGKFWDYRDKLFANQQKLDRENFIKFAKELGLDVSKFQQAFDSNKYKAAVDADVAEISGFGVGGTPAFFVNGHYLGGAKPFGDFAKVIDSELARLKIPSPNTARAAPPVASPAG